MYNDCVHLVDDDISRSTGGCDKCYVSCPYIIRDNMDMSCGGACYERRIDEEESDSNEDNKNECVRD